jgi:DNA-binding cell septation regulator SpoVG
MITIKHYEGKYPSFDVNLHVVEGAEPFLTIKGCKIMSGKNGPFVSYPATKNEKTGKWWNHVYGGEKFNEEVLKLAQQEPAKQKKAPDISDQDIPW